MYLVTPFMTIAILPVDAPDAIEVLSVGYIFGRRNITGTLKTSRFEKLFFVIRFFKAWTSSRSC